MSAVEQAREKLVSVLSAADGSPALRELSRALGLTVHPDARPNKQDIATALLAAVRAERDAAWREGVEKLEQPYECSHGTGCECGDWASGYNEALTDLAARMEAK